MIFSFNLSKIPEFFFGPGKFNNINDAILRFGKNVLIVKGAKSFKSSDKWDKLIELLERDDIKHFNVSVDREPSPDFIDKIVLKYKEKKIEVVIAIGGGSVIDAGKAISAMLLQSDSVFNYLEGMGKGKVHNGIKVPFIAVPTTSGTGSEATKNAVLSSVGEDGYKKSIRHDNFIPDIAVIDPELIINCPASVTASSGLDAFTQLLESYVSIKANIMTDVLVKSAMGSVKGSIQKVFYNPGDIDARSKMAYAAFISGITLANAGLGVVHGFASSIGGLYDIPHGVICGTLVGSATRININLLKKKGDIKGLNRYADIGKLLSSNEYSYPLEYCDLLCDMIDEWIEEFKLPLLSKYNIKPEDVEKIVKITQDKNNPVELSEKDKRDILSGRI